MRDLTVTRSHPRTAIRPRRVAWLVAALVVGTLVVPTSVAMAKSHCDAKVRGSSAESVHAARDRAGRGGTVCFPSRTYSGTLHLSVAGQRWKLASGATLTGPVVITGSKARLVGGRITRSTDNKWIASVEIRANGVRVKGVRFSGGGAGVGVYGVDGSRISQSSFRGLSGSAISIWSEGRGADRTRIIRNSIVQTITYQVSPIMSRGNESTNRGGVQNRDTVIKRNLIDQGQGSIGWFGIELKHSRGTVVEHNTIRGGRVLVSLPETDRAVIRWNTLDLRGSPDWGVEVANAHHTTVARNKILGDGSGGNDYAVAINTNSQYLRVHKNRARDIRTLVGIAGNHLKITDNCLTRVKFVHEFRQNGGPNLTVARNKAC